MPIWIRLTLACTELGPAQPQPFILLLLQYKDFLLEIQNVEELDQDYTEDDNDSEITGDSKDYTVEQLW